MDDIEVGDVYTSCNPWPHGRKVRVEVQPGTTPGVVWWRRVGVDHLASADAGDFHAAFTLTAPAPRRREAP